MKLADLHEFNIFVSLCFLYTVNHANDSLGDASGCHVHSVVGSIQLNLLQCLFRHDVFSIQRRLLLILQHVFISNQQYISLVINK